MLDTFDQSTYVAPSGPEDEFGTVQQNLGNAESRNKQSMAISLKRIADMLEQLHFDNLRKEEREALDWERTTR